MGANRALIAGILGARIVFILQDLGYYASHLDEVFSVQFSGLTSFGGLIFAVIALGIWARKQGVPMQRIFDICAPAFAVGHIVGRMGCFLNGCCFGVPGHAPWCMRFPPGSPPDAVFPGQLLHPSQLYNAAGMTRPPLTERERDVDTLSPRGVTACGHATFPGSP